MEERFVNLLVERALTMDAEKMIEFVEAVHANVILPEFDEALFRRLYQDASEVSRHSAVRLLAQREQPVVSPA